jgi:type III restriction enzyme
MMLREGWDVKNVTVVLGLRPFTAKAEILPEQVIGRGLRLMPHVTPDRTQPVQERLAYDIAIPITKPTLVHDIRKLVSR